MTVRDDKVPFWVWPKDASDAYARATRRLALSPEQAAEMRAHEDWINGQTSWPITYCVRDGVNGTIWEIDVTIERQPTFVAREARVIELPAATHVLWGGHALCGDLRLRGVPGSWPAGHRWISLKDAADGVEAPSDRCEVCWGKSPARVDELRQFGTVI